ncbi:flagellar hook-length control protein FliK [Pelagibacterium sp.]|uniref:flagellar hook-length control protein FliK n=1 Tax=Pelagibacterium sp. TaxID=1967288 RepID=UPI003BAD0DA3
MTNAISIGTRAAPLAVPAKPGAGIQTGGAIDFSSLIALGPSANPGTGHQIGTSSAPSIPTADALVGMELAAELGTELSALFEKLTALSEKLKDSTPIDETDLDELQNLLAAIEGLIDQGAPLPALGSPALTALSDLAAELDLDIAKDFGPLDTLAALSSRIADTLRDDAPEIAAQLTGLARTLDSHVATLQSAMADEQAQAAVAVKHVQSETRLNPAATIAAQAGETAEPESVDKPAPGTQKSDSPAGSERSLVQGNQSSQSPSAKDTKPGTQHNGAAGGPAATSPQENLETPDGLTIQPSQAQPSTSGPAALTRPEAALYQRPEAQINLPHIAAEISRHIQNGVNRFEIRLNPPELGRIDVRMEMDNSGNVVARLAVERSETLDLLQRDQRALERALTDAGLDASKTELEFSLGQHNGGNDRSDAERAPWRMSVVDAAAETSSSAAALPDRAGSTYGYARLDAVNLWV